MKKYYLGLFFLYIFIYLLPLGGRPLITPDEFRYGEIPREMIQSGNWVTPKLVGVRYFEKPVMGYWLNAVSMVMFGETRFGVRFASAFTTGLAAFLLILMALRKSRDHELALLSGGIFLTFGIVYGIGTFSVLDPPTTLFITGTMVMFFYACGEERFNWKKFLYLAAAGVFAGMAFLTKGFLAFAVPAVAIVPYLIWEKRWKDIFILPWIPAFFVVLTAIPWSIMIHMQEPKFWDYFFWIEHVQRFFKKVGTQHPEPFWFFIPVFLGGTLPWILFLPGAFTAVKTKVRDLLNDPKIKYSLCWFIFPFLFFSASRGKLPTYILPCFAPAAILFAWGMLEYFRNNGHKIFDWTAKILMILMIIGGIGFAGYQVLALNTGIPELFQKHETWKWIIAAAGIAFWAGCLWIAATKRDYRIKLTSLLVAPAIALFISHFAAPDRAIAGKVQGVFLSQFKDKIKPDTILVVHPNVMHAASWVFKKNNILFYIHGGELEDGLKYEDSKARIISRDKFLELLKKPRKGNIVFIMRGDFREGIPKADFEAYKHEIMFSVFQ
jgi:4-amino-4-deoxy-L-arabinose transferase